LSKNLKLQVVREVYTRYAREVKLTPRGCRRHMRMSY